MSHSDLYDSGQADIAVSERRRNAQQRVADAQNPPARATGAYIHFDNGTIQRRNSLYTPLSLIGKALLDYRLTVLFSSTCLGLFALLHFRFI